MTNNPWGSSGNGNDTGNDANDGEASGPRNPWAPGAKGAKGGPASNIEDLFKKRIGGGGSGGGLNGGGLPFKTEGRGFWGALALIALVLWLLSTSVWRLAEEQEGVVTRLGAFSRIVGPGINITLPYPFERLEKVDVNTIRTSEIGRVGDKNEKLVLTSDQNIIDLAYEVRWSIKDPRSFLFRLDDPERTVAEVAQSAMRSTVANFKLTDAIGPGRGDMEADVRKRMQSILNGYGAGITIQSITIREADPPAEVKEAFREVNAAQQQRESYINESRAYAQQVTERAQGDATSFNKVYDQYKLAPEVTRRRMYYETMETILQESDKTVVEAGGVTPYLPLPEVRKQAQKEPTATSKGGE